MVHADERFFHSSHQLDNAGDVWERYVSMLLCQWRGGGGGGGADFIKMFQRNSWRKMCQQGGRYGGRREALLKKCGSWLKKCHDHTYN